MFGKSISLRELRTQADARVPPRHGLRVLAIFLLLETLLLIGLSLIASRGALAELLKGEVRTQAQDGYVRLVFAFAQDIGADVRLANNILVVAFKTPVDVAVDKIAAASAGYVSVVRRDPDGAAVRLALTRKVTVNTMAAGDRLFVDLLPETWTGLPPGLPQDVINELTARAREAERLVRAQQQVQAQQRARPPITVRVAQQPTFTRYVFDVPETIQGASERDADSVTVIFDAPLKFDLADVKAALPPTVSAVEAGIGEDSVSLKFSLVGKVDVRSFREDNSYILDIAGRARRDAPRPQATPASQSAPAQNQPAPPRELSAVQTPPAEPARATPEPAEKPSAAGVPLPPPRPATAPPRPPTAAAQTEPVPAPPVAPSASSSPPSAPGAPPRGSDEEGVTLPLLDSKPVVAAMPPPAAAAPTPVESSPAAAGEEPRLRSRDASEPVAVEVKRQGETVRLTFPFVTRISAAVFRRFDTLWLVFDAAAPIDLSALVAAAVPNIRGAEILKLGTSQTVRIKLDRPKLASMALDGTGWTVSIGDIVLDHTRALTTMRNAAGARASVSIGFDEPQRVHRIADPDVGDTLIVVTGFGPAQGFLKPQDFVEFRALPSTHGVVIQPLADELTTELATDRIIVSRPGGLTLSPVDSSALGQRSGYRSVLLDTQLWGFDRQAQFLERRDALVRAAAEASTPKRTAARLELARFYLAREMYPEAKGILDVAISDDRATAEDPSAVVLRAIANTMMGRPSEGIKDLATPVVGNQQYAPLWRGLAFARQGKWTEARQAFKDSEAAITALPIELQRVVMTDALRAAIEVGDYGEASRILSEFDALGVPREIEATITVLKGRLAEGLGRISEALQNYRTTGDSWDRPAAMQARLRDITLSHQIGEVNRATAIPALEALTTIWRGDETEIEALQLVARLYTEEGRYRDAFHVMRTAMAAHPTSEMTRRIQESAAATFDALFLAGKGDAMPAIEALSLFYDYNELTPIGRRGDEMIRRLADRLVSIDLLEQAAELLQHQVDRRLQGAARAQVAARLAVVYLMNGKPDRALQALRATRSSELTRDLRGQRLLLEARALSDTGRHDLALEVIADMSGREVERLRADILWAARRWAEAAEQVERLYGDRWREFAPLNDTERVDLLRAAIGYALADDALGLDRFRQRYIAKMLETADGRTFEVLTSPSRSGSPEFIAAARTVGAANTLDGFLREMRARYPDFGTAAAVPPAGG